MSAPPIDWAKIYDIATYQARAVSLAYGRPSSLEFEDLVQTGVLAAIEAVPRFDPTRGLPFSGFVRSRIRGAMLDAMMKELKRPYLGRKDSIDGVTPPHELTDLHRALGHITPYQREVISTHLAGTRLKHIARAKKRSYHHIRHTYLDAIALMQRRLSRTTFVRSPEFRPPYRSA